MKTIEQCIAEIEEQLAQLKARAEAKASSDEWPKVDDLFYQIHVDGEVGSLQFDGCEYDQRLSDIGNMFRTKEEAEREVERRKVLTELRKLAKASWDGVEYNWAVDHQAKYVLYFAHAGREWEVTGYSRTQHVGQVHFRTQEAAEQAIKTIGTDRLMRLLED